MKPANDLIRKRDNVFEKRGLVGAPIEVVEKRTERSKTFSLGANQYHLSQSIAPIHYKINDRWEEIDLTFRATETEGGLVYRMDKACYIAEVFTDRVGWRHSSREGWWRQVELVAIDGRPIEYNGEVRINDNVVLYDSVAPGIDMKVCAFRLKSEVFKKLEQPCELTWRVTSSEDAGGAFQDKTEGWDKDGDTLEMLTVLDGEMFTERWTGRVSKIQDKRTRRKGWTTEPSLPVVVDAAIQENIASGADDAQENNASSLSTDGYYLQLGLSTYFNQLADIGLRFQTVAIPTAATISAAVLTVNVTNKTGTPGAKIYADDVDNAAAWSAGNRPTQITKTTAAAVVAGWATGTGRTLDVLGPVGEVLGRGGWSSSNNLRLAGLHTNSVGNNFYLIEAFDAPGTNEAQLDVTYTAGGGSSSPAQAQMRNFRGIEPGAQIGGQ